MVFCILHLLDLLLVPDLRGVSTISKGYTGQGTLRSNYIQYVVYRSQWNKKVQIVLILF